MKDALNRFIGRSEEITKKYNELISKVTKEDGNVDFGIVQNDAITLDELARGFEDINMSFRTLVKDMETVRSDRRAANPYEEVSEKETYAKFSELIKTTNERIREVSDINGIIGGINRFKSDKRGELETQVVNDELTLGKIDKAISAHVLNAKRALYLRQNPEDTFLVSNRDILEPYNVQIKLTWADSSKFEDLKEKRNSLTEEERNSQNFVYMSEINELNELLAKREQLVKKIAKNKNEINMFMEGEHIDGLTEAAMLEVSGRKALKTKFGESKKEEDKYKELKDQIASLKERYFAEVKDLNNYEGLIKRPIKELDASVKGLSKVQKEAFNLWKKNISLNDDEEKAVILGEFKGILDNMSSDLKSMTEVATERKNQMKFFDDSIKEYDNLIKKEEAIINEREAEIVGYRFILGEDGYSEAYLQKYNKVHKPTVNIDDLKDAKNDLEEGITSTNYYLTKIASATDSMKAHSDVRAKHVKSKAELIKAKALLEKGVVNKYWAEKLAVNKDVILGECHYNDVAKEDALASNKKNIKVDSKEEVKLPETTKAPESTKAPEATKAPETTKAPEVPATLPETKIDDKEKAKKEEKSSPATKEDKPIHKDTWVTKLKKKFSNVGDYVKNHPVKTGLMAAAGVGAGVVVVNLVPLLPTVGMVAAGYFIYKELDKAGVLGK